MVAVRVSIALWQCGTAPLSVCVGLHRSVAVRDCTATCHMGLHCTVAVCDCTSLRLQQCGTAQHCGSSKLTGIVVVWDCNALWRCGAALHCGSVGVRSNVAVWHCTPLWQCGTERR